MSTSKKWYQEAVFYEVPIKSFCDGNGDGIGDFIGLTQKLDYIKKLGIDCIWLLPFFPSPSRDDGYDVSNFYDIHPEMGKMKDFKKFIKNAKKLGIRVIADLVMNHTSDQHPWFIDAKSSKTSKKRDYYVWNDTDDKYSGVRVIFNDIEKSNWHYDKNTSQYYWHRFFYHQPDLNFESIKVQDEMFKVIDFWLKKGLDGFRVDAIPYLFEEEGTSCENLPQTHAYLKRLRSYIDKKYGEGEKLLLAEANMVLGELKPYFGDGTDEFHMAYHFPLMTNLFYALAQQSKTPLIEIIKEINDIPEGCFWAIFLRNHDELTLEKVSEEIRQYMWDFYAPLARMRLNLGIRRRLAPLLKNDRKKIELLYSIIFSLPGCPIIYYGDEIGMGDNIQLDDRNGVRTPMQWNKEAHAGFARPSTQKLIFPLIESEKYHYQTVNVENQISDQSSLFSFISQLIKIRKEFPILSSGKTNIVQTDSEELLVYTKEGPDGLFMVINNLSPNSKEFEYKNKSLIGKFENIRSKYLVEIINGTSKFFLKPFEFQWFTLLS